jgi:hypothetical protein
MKLSSIIIAIVLIIANFNFGFAQETGISRVVMVSTLDFVPEILEMVRKNFVRKIAKNASLVFHPFEKEFQQNIDARSSYLLLEEGMPSDQLSHDFVKTGNSFRLVWLLVARHQFLEEMNGENLTLEKFGQALLARKKKVSHVYPWFESLYSKNTLLNLFLLLGTAEKNRSLSDKPFWEQKGAIRILYRAMEEGLLNPLSVEADQLLSTNVFLAGDSICTTLWVPEEFLYDSTLARESLGDARLIPFPDQNGSLAVPRKTFWLWQKKSIEKSELFVNPELASCSYKVKYLDRKFSQDLDWMESEFSQAYDMLIMGDF